MTGRDELLAAIRANPRDEALRLVYADWLEEHGDEQDRRQAQFIRLQCRVEPLRDRYHDKAAAALFREEATALWQNRDHWLGAPLSDTS